MTVAPTLLSQAGRTCYLVADQAYDADDLRRTLLHVAGTTPVIAGRRNRKPPIRDDRRRYRGRHPIENVLCRLKDFRRITTRYDKLAANVLSAVAFWP